MRKYLSATVALVGILVLGLPGRGLAQPWAATPTQGIGRQFDASTITTMSGSITRIERVPHGGRGAGVHLILDVKGKPVTVALGPSWFVDEQAMKLEPGNTVDVTGSQITQEGQTIIVATEVHMGGAVMQLRSKDGVPMWSGGRP